MPLSSDASFVYAVDSGARLALAQMGGTVTGADMRLIVETVHADPAWQPGFDAIWDCTRVAAHVVSPGEVEPILEAIHESETGRDLLIEGPGLAADLFAMLLVFRVRRRGDDASAYRSVDEALAALGRDALPELLRQIAVPTP